MAPFSSLLEVKLCFTPNITEGADIVLGILVDLRAVLDIKTNGEDKLCISPTDSNNAIKGVGTGRSILNAPFITRNQFIRYMIVVVIYEDMPSQKIAMTVEDLRQQTLDDVYTIFANPLQSSQTFNAANKDGDKPEERMQSQMSFEQLYLWLPGQQIGKRTSGTGNLVKSWSSTSRYAYVYSKWIKCA